MSDGMASSACLKDCLTETADLQDYTFHQTPVRDLVPQCIIGLLSEKCWPVGSAQVTQVCLCNTPQICLCYSGVGRVNIA